MNPLEQHLKDRFADASAPVSPAGQDALWVAVEGSLDGKRNRGAFWFVLGGLFATALSIVAIWYLRAPADADQLAWAGATAPTTFKGWTQTASAGHSALLGQNAVLTSGEAGQTTASGEADQTPTKGALTTGMRSGVAGMPPSDAPQPDAPVVEASTPGIAANTPPQTLEPAAAAVDRTTEARAALPAARTAPDHTPPAPRMPLNLLPLLQPDWTPATLIPTLTATSRQVTGPGKPWAIRAYGGATWSSVRYTGEGTSDINSYQRPDWGWSAGAGFQLDMRPGRRLEVGLGLNECYHRLDFERTTVSQVLVEDQLIEIQVNAITGDTVALIYGEVLATRTDYQRVLHHNRQRTLSVPVEWQWVRTAGRFEAGLGLGAVLHVQLEATGRSLNSEGEVVNYTRTDAPQAAVSLSPQLRPFVGVSLSPAWRLDAAMPVGLQWGRFEDWNTCTTLGGLQVGLTRRF